MKKITAVFLSLILFTLIIPEPLLASGFGLKSVGGIDVDGAAYKHLWHTSGNITISGIAPAGSSVTATIDGTASTITSDSSGSFSHSVSLAEGDHQVSFSQDTNTISFTLTIGTPPAGIGMPPKAQIPPVGTVIPTMVIFFSGISCLLLATVLKKRLTS